MQVHHAEDAVWLEMAAAESEDLNLWCMAGHKLVARGQAALLMLAGESDQQGGGRGRSEGGKR